MRLGQAIEDFLDVQCASMTASGDIYPATKTVREWFDGDLPTVVPVGTATSPDSCGDEEQMAINRSVGDGPGSLELVDDDGVFCGILRRDDDGWLFITPGIMFDQLAS